MEVRAGRRGLGAGGEVRAGRRGLGAGGEVRAGRRGLGAGGEVRAGRRGLGAGGEVRAGRRGGKSWRGVNTTTTRRHSTMSASPLPTGCRILPRHMRW